MDLFDWHCRLHDHFKRLRATRQQVHPVFALEHGLAEEARETLESEIRAHVEFERPSVKHRLAWVVYAAEVGYRYRGDEYWQTFEAETPGWAQHGDRYWIRTQFHRFAEEFGGAKPGGAWAKWFSIICWPITHAILPQDLQLYLARLLYEARGSIRDQHLASPSLLGKHLAGYGDSDSSRFQNFLQEHELVGQIATALLLQEEDSAELLEPTALHRIIKDLEATEKAKVWLRITRRQVQQKVRGLRPVTAPRPSGNGAGAAADRRVVPTCDFLLLPSQDAWDLLLETPDLSGVAFETSEIKQWLAATRYRVEASDAPPKPASNLLRGRQSVRLTRWPQADRPLLQFDRDPPAAASALITALNARPDYPRLFKLQADGSARALRSGIVRPGAEYLLVSPSALPSVPGSTPVALKFPQVAALRLALPEVLDRQWLASLQQLELSPSGSIRVWPVGVVPAVWDDTGRGEWLEYDPIALGVQVTGQCRELLLTLDGASTLRLDPNAPRGAAWYLQLPQLSPGLHRLRCRVILPFDRPGGEYTLEIAIREPRRGSPAGSAQTPLSLLTDPPYPTLEQVWEDQVQFYLSGPAVHRVTARFQLLTRYNGEVLHEALLPALTLPVDRSAWSGVLQELRQNKKVQAAYDQARAGRLIFNAQELGQVTLSCERTHTPLRWAVQGDRSRVRLRLIDETGGETPTQVVRFDARTPDVPEPLSAKKVLSGIDVEGDALYLACQWPHLCGMVATKGQWNWQEFQQQPTVRVAANDSASLHGLVHLIRSWRRAHQSGNVMSATRQAQASEALHQWLLQGLCGPRFMVAEERYRSDPRGETFEALLREALPQDVRVLQPKTIFLNPTNRSLSTGESVMTRARGLSKRIADYRWCPSLNETSPADREWLTAFALCLASAPESLPGWAKGRLKDGLKAMLRHRQLVSIARSFVLALNHPPVAATGTPALTIYWEWE